MDGQLLRAPSLKQEAELYEDLSQLIKLLRKVLRMTEAMASRVEQHEDCTELALGVRDTVEQHWTIVDHYSFALTRESQHHNTFHRFVCRLLEQASSLRARNSGQVAGEWFNELVERTGAALQSYQTTPNVGAIFRKILGLALQFVSRCQQAQAPPDDQPSQQLSPGVEGKTQADREGQRRGSFNQQTHFHRMLAGINRKFRTTSCLDLDYNSFKSQYFRCMNSQREYQREYTQRNLLALRSTQLYSREFQAYAKKKERNHLRRRNRLKQERPKQSLLANHSCLASTSHPKKPQSLSGSPVRNTRITTKREGSWVREETESGQQEQFKKFLEIDFKSMGVQKRKTSYQMRNVYLTLNKVTSEQPRGGGVRDKVRPNATTNALKINKYALKGSKFYSQEAEKPLLDVRACQGRHVMVGGERVVNPYDVVNGTSKVGSKRIISEKKNHFILQSIKRGSVTEGLKGEEQEIQIRILDPSPAQPH